MATFSTAALGFAASFAPPAPSAAVTKAKAQFRTPATTAPWQSARPPTPGVTQIMAARSLLGPERTGMGDDLQTIFRAWSSLASLEALSKAAHGTASDVQRVRFDARFSAGLTELQAFLASAPTPLTDIAFEQVARTAQSIAVPAASARVMGAEVAAARTAPLPDAAGRYTLALTKGGRTDTVVVDLTAASPTMDVIVERFNAAIASIPLTDARGEVVLDGNGEPVSRHLTRFRTERGATGWRLVQDGVASEQVRLTETDRALSIGVVTPQAAGNSAILGVARINEPGAGFTRTMLSTLSARDGAGERLAALRQTPDARSAPTAAAAIRPAAVAGDDQGFLYVLGTTRGDVGAWTSGGREAMVLSKLDPSGKPVWQRLVGSAGATQGAALAVAAGAVTVVGTAQDGAQAAALVTTFDEHGAPLSSSQPLSLRGAQPSALARVADGTLLIAGRGPDGAFLDRVQPDGRSIARASLGAGLSIAAISVVDGGIVVAGTDAGRAVAIRVDPATLVATGRTDLGEGAARALAVDADGRILVAQDGADGAARLTVLAADGLIAATATLGSGTRADSVALAGERVLIGGRAGGESLIAAFDRSTLASAGASRWNSSGTAAGPTLLSSWRAGPGGLAAMGLRPGGQADPDAARLVRSTPLLVGDRFQVAAGSRRLSVSIGAEDTFATVAARINRFLGQDGRANVVPTPEGQRLRIEARTAADVSLTAGPAGGDALAKLGLSPRQVTPIRVRGADETLVQPGGLFSLNLSTALNLRGKADARMASEMVGEAKAKLESAYRSLYWDAAKERIVAGSAGPRFTPAEAARFSAYQEALRRLGG